MVTGESAQKSGRPSNNQHDWHTSLEMRPFKEWKNRGTELK